MDPEHYTYNAFATQSAQPSPQPVVYQNVPPAPGLPDADLERISQIIQYHVSNSVTPIHDSLRNLEHRLVQLERPAPPPTSATAQPRTESQQTGRGRYFRYYPYTGGPNEDLDGWMLAVELAFAKDDTAESNKVNVVIEALEGLAKSWFVSKLHARNDFLTTHRVNTPADLPVSALTTARSLDEPILVDWPSFKKAIRQRFTPVNQTERYYHDLVHLKHQKGHISDYIQRFTLLDSLLRNIPPAAEKIYWFKVNLHESIRAIVERAHPQTLAAAIREAELAEMADTPLNQRGNSHLITPTSARPTIPFPSQVLNPPTITGSITPSDPFGTAPMDLDTVEM